MRNKYKWWRALSTGLTLGLSLYILADTFLIQQTYARADSTSSSALVFAETDAAADAGTAANTESAGAVTDTGTGTVSEGAVLSAYADAEVVGSYSDENIKITVYSFYENDTAIYAADVQLSSVEYLRSAFARSSYGKNVTDTTSSIAEEVNAILAINGDYYGARESGYVIRNGQVYRDTGDKDDQVLCIYSSGDMQVVRASDYTAQELAEAGVWQAYTFGPALVSGGELSVSGSEEVGKAMTSNPRTAIGMIGEGHYLFVVSDGRTGESQGLSLYQLAQVMANLGCTTAYNLDGGGSSTMVFQGEVINQPTTTGRKISERKVSDIVYIGA